MNKNCFSRSILWLAVVLVILSVANCQFKIGGYEVKEQTAINKYCDGQNTTALKNKGTTYKPQRYEFLGKFYGRIRDPLLNFLKTRSYIQFIKEGWLPFTLLVLPPLIGLLVALIYSPFAILWTFHLCCFKRTKEDRFEKKFDFWKTCTNWTVGTLMVFTLAMGAIWARDCFLVMGQLKPLSCASAITFSEVSDGFVTGGFFPGISGYNFLLDKMNHSLSRVLNRNSTTKYAEYVNTTTDASKKNLNTTADNLNAAISNYNKSYSQSKVMGCANNAVTTRTSTLARMLPTISTPIEYQTNNLTLLGKNIYTSASMMRGLLQNTSNSSDVLLNGIRSFLNMTQKVKTETDTVKDLIMKNFDYDRVHWIGMAALIIFVSSIFLVLLLYMIFWFVNSVLKSMNWLIYFSKSIMLCTLLLGCLLSIIAVATVAVSTVFVNGCDLFDKGLEDRNLMKTFNFGPMFDKMMDSCLYSNSSGDITELIKQTEAEGPFSSALLLFAGFLNSSNYTAIATMTDDSLETRKYFNNLTQIAVKVLDPYELPAEDLKNRIGAINPVLSSATGNGNTVQMDEETCRITSQTNSMNDASPLPTYKNVSSYCLVLPTYNVVTNFSDRYTIAPSIITDLNSLKKCQLNYSALVTNLNKDMDPSIATTPTAISVDMRQSISSAFANLTSLRNDLTEPCLFMESGPIFSNYQRLFNCSIVRPQILFMRSQLCGTFTDEFSAQSFWLHILGPLISLLGIFMCLQLRIVVRDMNKLPAHMKTETDPAVEMNELML